MRNVQHVIRSRVTGFPVEEIFEQNFWRKRRPGALNEAAAPGLRMKRWTRDLSKHSLLQTFAILDTHHLASSRLLMSGHLCIVEPVFQCQASGRAAAR